MDSFVKSAMFMAFFVMVLHVSLIFASSQRGSVEYKNETINTSLEKKFRNYFELSHQPNTKVTHWPRNKMKVLPKFVLQILNASQTNGLEHKNLAKVLYNAFTNTSTVIGFVVQLVMAQLENILGYKLTTELVHDLIIRIDKFDFAGTLKPLWEKIKHVHVDIAENFDNKHDQRPETSESTLEDAFNIAFDIATDEKALSYLFEKLKDPNEMELRNLARLTYYQLEEFDEEREFNMKRKGEAMKDGKPEQ